MSEYIKPRTVFVGGKNNVKKVGLGGNEPVSIQTMCFESNYMFSVQCVRFYSN